MGDPVATICEIPYTGDAVADHKGIFCYDANFKRYPEWSFFSIAGTKDYAAWSIFQADVAYNKDNAASIKASYKIELAYYFRSTTSQALAYECYNGKTVDYESLQGAFKGTVGKRTYTVPDIYKTDQIYYDKGSFSLPTFTIEAAEDKLKL